MNSELVSGRNPFPNCPASLLKVADREIDQLGCGIVDGHAAACFCGFPDHPIQIFDCIHRVDDFTHGGREGKKWDQLLPSAPPAWSNGGVFAAPSASKSFRALAASPLSKD